MKFNNLLKRIANLKGEIGGYFELTNTNKICFVTSDLGKRNISTGREYVELPTSTHHYIWHYHPVNLGIWPSFEDLLISTPSKNKRFGYYLNIIVTNHGSWVFDGIQGNKRDFNVNDLFKTWNKFHLFMSLETQRRDGWNLPKIQQGIEQFRYELFMQHGFRITFIDNGLFRRVSILEYIKEVEGFINYIIPLHQS